MEAVLDGLTGSQTLRGKLFWPWCKMTLSARTVEAIVQTVNSSVPGTNPKLINLSHRRCCGMPMVVVETFYEARNPAFTDRHAAMTRVCSVCGTSYSR